MYLLTIISSIGSVQGAAILLSILLRFRHRKNIPLALLLMVFSFRLATIPTWTPDILLLSPWVYPLTAPLPFLFGPLLWCSVREIVNETPKYPRYFPLHLLPYLFEVTAVSYTLISMNRGEYSSFIHNIFTGNPPLWLPLRNGLKVILNLVYIIFSIRIAFSRKAKHLSSLKRIWLRALVIIPSLVLLSFSYVAVAPSATMQLIHGETTPFIILSLTMAGLLYTVSFLIMVSPELYLYRDKSRDSQREELCSREECEYLVGLLDKRFTEGAYKNPDLVISDFAAEFDVHPNRLSYAVNRCCHTSFRDLLNTRRLEYFSGRIKDGAYHHQSILEIAFEAGFPSKSTFNRIYKEKMGIPPSQFIKNFEKT